MINLSTQYGYSNGASGVFLLVNPTQGGWQPGPYSWTTGGYDFAASRYNSVYGRDSDPNAVIPRSLSTRYYIRY